jgi:hypothetical protein
MTNISTTEWVAGLGWVDTAYITMFLKFLPDPSSWAELYNFLWANGHNYHDRWVIVIFYLHHSLEVCIIPNISTTQWVAGIGRVDTAYVTMVLQVLPDQNYIIAYQQMAIITMSIGW